MVFKSNVNLNLDGAARRMLEEATITMNGFRSLLLPILLIFWTLPSFTLVLASQPPSESAKGDHLTVRFVAPEKFSSDRETWVALYFKPDEEWHVYWKNPGDSGAAPKFDFATENAEVGSVQWPAPTRLPVAHLTNLGYHGDVAYLFAVKPNGQGRVRLTANLEWLVCKEECIPGFAKLTLERDTSSSASSWKPENEAITRRFASLLPQPSEQAPFQISRVQHEGTRLKVHFNGDVDQDLDVFPVQGEYLSPAAPDRIENEFSFKINSGASQPKSFGFVVKSPRGVWEFSDLTTSANGPATETASMLILLLSAIAGGFLLNLMPCVFPVISMKAFSLLKTSGRERVRDCLLYSAGVLTTFAGIAVALLLLRQAGSSVGWGFQLQSPLVIFALIVLFWTMALNFLGVFEFGDSVMNLAGRQRWLNSSFGTGVLSVFIAAPCTGPFMGTALGAAAVVPPFSAFLIIVSLGVGLTLPFLLFAAFPKVLAWLPRPGAWMETLKQFFAFPLFATVIWLLWVLGQQIDTQGWIYASLALLALSFSFWINKTRLPLRTPVAVLVALLSIASAGHRIHFASASEKPSATGTWKNYDDKELFAYLVQGKSVFIDFTAAWCITCQVNKQAVLETDAGLTAFAKQDVVLMRADWTNNDPKITETLNKLGRNSVPVYAYYHRGSQTPVLLPQILTLSMIENLNQQEAK